MVPVDLPLIATIADGLPVGVWVARVPSGEFVYANQEFQDIMGMGPREDVAAGTYAQPYGIHDRSGALYPEDRMPFVRAMRERVTVVTDDIVVHRSDGRRVNIRASGKPLFDGKGELTHVVVAFIDITREVLADRARVESEKQLAQAQRLESIGKLAGGVAHDFNNLMATVKLLTSVLRMRERDAERLGFLQQIDKVVESATGLTQGLLAFARRGDYEQERVQVNQVAESVLSLFERTVERSVVVRRELAPASLEIIGDPSRLEQVLMNLAVNGRDAMLSGGTLTVRTRSLHLERPRPPLLAGPHVVVEVEDTGTGIAPEIRERIFEPYFTSKVSGAIKGTGLGLATVLGIVTSHRGAIEVHPGSQGGTLMRVILPAAAAEGTSAPAAEPKREEPAPGSGLVLIIDDEPALRSASEVALKQLGYQILTAADGVEALPLYQRESLEISAVVLDLMMPRLDGRGTLRSLRQIRPDVKVLATTAAPEGEEAKELAAMGVRVLAKPYDVATLSHALAQVIAGK